MAGTDTDMRRLAQYKYDEAVKAGAPQGTIAILKADLDAWNAKEDQAMGKNGR